MTLETRFAEAMDRLLPEPCPRRLGVSVSGGGDSTALMYLVAEWAARAGVALHVVTVDHGLRPESAAEAGRTGAQAAGLNLPHTTLRLAGLAGGNLQDAARRARHALIDRWRGDIGHVLIGHTMDDQAETFLINLARGSGVAGLSGMGERMRIVQPDPVVPAECLGPMPEDSGQGGPGFVLLRPLLGERRETLRDWLREKGIEWSEDPSNDDPGFERVRIRNALRGDTGLGLDIEGLAATAGRLRRARVALEARAAQVARSITRIRHGDVIFSREALAGLEAETRATLLAHALRWVSSAAYRPRAQALAEVTEDVLDGRVRTLHGCLLIARGGVIRVTREEKAVCGLVLPFDGETVWDRRWLLRGPVRPGVVVRPLGSRGLGQIGPIPGGRDPRAALTALPALYQGEEVLALPGVLPGAWTAELRPPRGGFVEALTSA
ncbi:tRNA lysidine(34) synthetase TilS [Tropicimonas sp.]|uniref:tRNA lysidine(34) synthetase TilS n=1 Tax=Tropicimonas sp. TaxID=2067044 RepID=UPI003A8A5DEE